jgi:hypothetical protein
MIRDDPKCPLLATSSKCEGAHSYNISIYLVRWLRELAPLLQELHNDCITKTKPAAGHVLPTKGP